MNDESIRQSVTRKMLESGVVTGEDGHMYVQENGREYMILLVVVDLTDFPTKDDHE